MDHHKKNPYFSSTLSYLIEKSNLIKSLKSPGSLPNPDHPKISNQNRGKIIHWLAETSQSLSIPTRTIQLTISYIDLFLTLKQVPDQPSLELVTYACLSLALNYEENREVCLSGIKTPNAQNLESNKIRATQLFILNAFDWKLDHPTPNEIVEMLIYEFCEEFDSRKILEHAENFIWIALEMFETSKESAGCVGVAGCVCCFQSLGMKEFCEEWVRRVCGKYEISVREVGRIVVVVLEKVECYKRMMGK